MKPSECGKILVACGWFDNRKNSDEAMLAWSTALNPQVTVTEAIDAISVHYGASDEWCKPSHINAIVRAVQLRRIVDAGTPPIPPELEDDRATELEWLRSWQDSIRHGVDSAAAAVAADFEHNITRGAIAANPVVVKALESFAVTLTDPDRRRNAPPREDYSAIRPCPTDEAITAVRAAARKQLSEDEPDTWRYVVHSIGRRHMNWELDHLIDAIGKAETVEWCRGRGHDLAIIVDGRRTMFRVRRPVELRVSA